MSESHEPSNPTAKLVEGGSEIAGAAVGGALGLIGGPVGVAAGAAGGVLVTRTLKRVGEDITRRLIGPRQAVRMGAAVAFAADEIRERLHSGDREREDGWFEAADGGRPEADEILEGVLLSAANAYEERKVRYMGFLYASLAFDPTIKRGYANFLVRLAERLTYRQLAALALISSEAGRQALSTLDGVRDLAVTQSSDAVRAELSELGASGLIGLIQGDGSIAAPLGTWGGGSGPRVILGLTHLTPVGTDVVRLMKLDRIPSTDLAEVYAELGGDPGRLHDQAAKSNHRGRGVESWFDDSQTPASRSRASTRKCEVVSE